MTFIRNASILAAAILAAGSAFAIQGEATYEYPQAVASSITRAAVQADLLQARADGSLQVTEADFQRQPALASSTTRQAVLTERRAAASTGALIGTAERYGYDDVAPTASKVSLKFAALR